MSETASEHAFRLMKELNNTKQMRGMRSVNEFLKEWANVPIPPGVLDKACAVLDEADQYTPEQVAHRIVFVTLQAWIEAGTTR